MNFQAGRNAARPAAWGMAALIAGLTLVCASRAAAAVSVANESIVNLTIAAGADSPLQPISAAANNPGFVTVVNRTANDGVRGIASIAVSWVNVAPQCVLWTGTSKGNLVGGQTVAANTVLAQVGVGVGILTDFSGANLNRFKIRNSSAVAVTVSVQQIW